VRGEMRCVFVRFGLQILSLMLQDFLVEFVEHVEFYM